MDIKKISNLQIRKPRGSDHGRVETGYYTVSEDRLLTLVEESGIPVDRHKLSRKLKPDEDAHNIACALMRQRYSGVSDGGFNRKIIYPPSSKY